jgi:2-polyprenyl-6-methoxyphenol hydroxylase-like FAD-dependent oxidoreductase
MDVAIFGAGVAGLMSAIALQARGHRCHIYERARQSQQMGMGFILVPEGINELRRFGVEVAGVPTLHYYCRNEAGEVLYEETMPAGARSVRRADLIAGLVNALPSRDVITFDAALDGLEFDPAGDVVAARLVPGKQIQADLYVAADGGRSRARQTLFPEWPAREAQVMELVGIAACGRAIEWAGHNFNKFHAQGGGLAVGVVPVSKEQVVWYMQFDSRQFPPPAESADARRDFVTRLAGTWAHPIPLLLSLTDFSGVHLWRPVDTDVLPHFHQGNLALLGDAAHPLSPFTSQGVSSAIADAVALAKCVTAPQALPEAGIAEALAEYSAERRAQCAPYLAQGRALARDFLAPGSSVLLPIAQ